MNERKALIWFLYCELFNLDWGSHMKPIIAKYGCIVNALKHHKLYKVWCIIDDIDHFRFNVFFRIHMWLRRHYFHNL